MCFVFVLSVCIQSMNMNLFIAVFISSAFSCIVFMYVMVPDKTEFVSVFS